MARGTTLKQPYHQANVGAPVHTTENGFQISMKAIKIWCAPWSEVDASKWHLHKHRRRLIFLGPVHDSPGWSKQVSRRQWGQSQKLQKTQWGSFQWIVASFHYCKQWYYKSSRMLQAIIFSSQPLLVREIHTQSRQYYISQAQLDAMPCHDQLSSSGA